MKSFNTSACPVQYQNCPVKSRNPVTIVTARLCKLKGTWRTHASAKPVRNTAVKKRLGT